MSSEDSEYYRSRSIAETKLACAATDTVAAQIHAQNAFRYQALQDEAEGGTPCVTPATVVTSGPCHSARGFNWSG